MGINPQGTSERHEGIRGMLGKEIPILTQEVPYGRIIRGIGSSQQRNFLGIIDGQGRRVFKKKLPNELVLIRQTLQPFQGELGGIALESTYNWYWMVDGLMEEEYKVHLANPSAIQQYSGMKHSDDKHDAFWLAEMLRFL